MALILDFSEHASRSSGRSVRDGRGGSAEIVIFPGVRYERWDDDDDAHDAAVMPQRDRIELPD